MRSAREAAPSAAFSAAKKGSGQPRASSLAAFRAVAGCQANRFAREAKGCSGRRWGSDAGSGRGVGRRPSAEIERCRGPSWLREKGVIREELARDIGL